MSRQVCLKQLITRTYRLLLGLYPLPFQNQFREEMEAVFKSALEEQGEEHPLRLFWRELRHWPGSVLKAHLRARRRDMASNGFNGEKPLPRQELLAAMIIFLLPLFSLLAITEVNPPQWTDYVLLVTFWGSILFALGLAIAKRLPGWSLPYLGFVSILAVFLSPSWKIWEWLYPIFINTFGARSSWSVSISVLYAGIFDFVFALMILLCALVLVNLLRLLPYTRVVWERIRADWTQLSFMIYGGLVLYIMLTFDEYRYEDPWKFSAWVCLALGAWLYLRGKGRKRRMLALLGGTTGAFWIVALAKWTLVPLQKWPTGYPIAPSVTSLWVETGDALVTWLFFLGILIAPALTKWLPPLPNPLPVEGKDAGNAQTT